MSDPLVCPDPLAARRFFYAQQLAEQGEWAAAAELIEQALELAPGWAPACVELGKMREKSGEPDKAEAAYAEALRADPLDRPGAAPRLALLRRAPVAALPPAYVARLFDDYAPNFDAHLTQKLGYRGPEVIAAALDAVAPGRRFGLALDLGCGSGLSGRPLRGRVAKLAGVDISAGMIAKAQATGLYDSLAVADIVAFLETAAGAELVVAADALVYLGDLRPVFAAAARALAPGGLFAFTVESGEAEFALHEGMRFRHSDAHVRAAAATAGLNLRRLAPASTRREAGREAEGRVGVAQRG